MERLYMYTFLKQMTQCSLLYYITLCVVGKKYAMNISLEIDRF